MQKDTVPSVVMGVKTEAQLKENMGALGWELSPDEVRNSFRSLYEFV